MGIFDGFWDSVLNGNATGWFGETYTEFELGLVKMLGLKGEMLRNVYIPTDNSGTSEIDVLYITQKGIFVLESKNFSGWIFGDEKDRYWTASLPNGQKNKFYNPIMQNQTHIKWLGNYLASRKIPLFSIIAFSERCTLKKVIVRSKTKVVNRDMLYPAIREIWDNHPDVLSGEDVAEIWKQLKVLTNVGKEIKNAHIERIEERLQSKNTFSSPSERKCPRCGAKLSLRVARKGANAGKQFYGCSNFPKCRYTENVE